MVSDVKSPLKMKCIRTGERPLILLKTSLQATPRLRRRHHQRKFIHGTDPFSVYINTQHCQNVLALSSNGS